MCGSGAGICSIHNPPPHPQWHLRNLADHFTIAYPSHSSTSDAHVNGATSAELTVQETSLLELKEKSYFEISKQSVFGVGENFLAVK